LNNYASGRYININLDEVAEQTIGFTGADLLQLLNESLLKAALEGRDFIAQEDLLEAKDHVKPSALREFNEEQPKNRINEIENKEIINKLNSVVEDFCRNPCFKPVLLHQQLQLADKIASTMAYMTCERLHCPYIVARATWFRTRWFGEMERSIREFFERIKRFQPCVVYIRNIDAIANPEEEHLYGAILELLEHLTEFKDNNIKVLLLCSTTPTTYKLDSQILHFYEEVI